MKKKKLFVALTTILSNFSDPTVFKLKLDSINLRLPNHTYLIVLTEPTSTRSSRVAPSTADISLPDTVDYVVSCCTLEPFSFQNITATITLIFNAVIIIPRGSNHALRSIKGTSEYCY